MLERLAHFICLIFCLVENNALAIYDNLFITQQTFHIRRQM